MNKYLLAVLCSSFLFLQACKKTEKAPTEKVIEIETKFGNMYMWLYKETPLHRENFLKLAEEGFYDGTTFHRIIKGFMIQGGDPNSKDDNPNNDGLGGPGYTIPAEFMEGLKNIRGAVASARTNNDVNPEKASSGSQFFINVVDNPGLDQEYTVFGTIIKGMEVADQIAVQEKDKKDRPLTDIKMTIRVLEKTEAELLEQYGFSL